MGSSKAAGRSSGRISAAHAVRRGAIRSIGIKRAVLSDPDLIAGPVVACDRGVQAGEARRCKTVMCGAAEDHASEPIGDGGVADVIERGSELANPIQIPRTVVPRDPCIV